MTTKADLELLKAALQTSMQGGALPSFRDAKMAELLRATVEAASPSDDVAGQRLTLMSLGLASLGLLLDRMQMSMVAERETALATDRARGLC